MPAKRKATAKAATVRGKRPKLDKKKEEEAEAEDAVNNTTARGKRPKLDKKKEAKTRDAVNNNNNDCASEKAPTARGKRSKLDKKEAETKDAVNNNDCASSSDEDDDDDDDEEQWENVLPITTTTTTDPLSAPAPAPAAPLELTLNPAPPPAASTTKKGASNEARRIRFLTHCMHVQFQLFHGHVRNTWANDPEVQALVLSHVPSRVLTGLEENGERGLSGLVHWWRGRFVVDKPGLRKVGYKSLQRMKEEGEGSGEKVVVGTTAYRRRGETIEGVEGLRRRAAVLRGSRDTGALLLTALCRALGFEARLVFSLQPLGFGFTKTEMAVEEEEEEEEEEEGKKFAAVGKGNKKMSGKKPAAAGKGKGKREQADMESSPEVSDASPDSDSDGGGGFVKRKRAPKKPPKPSKIDSDLPCPLFWTELLSPSTNTYLSLSAFPTPLLGHTPEVTSKFEPRGGKSRQIIAYVVAYSPHGDDARDVTIRYLRNRTLPGKTKGFRIPPEDVPVYDISGQKMDSYRVDWFAGVLSAYQRKPRENWSQAEIAEADELERWMEGEGEGVPDKKKGAEDENITTISGYKNHPTLVLERHLKRDEAVIPGRTPTTTLTTGKGSAKVTENVYQRSDIAVCKTAENWYREEGLTIKSGEQPLKQVKRRAATLTRKREIEAQLREGETAMQGMYARHQTEPYVPPPVVDGKVLTNAFGNIDVYVPSMVPEGGVHVPLKGAGRVAKKLGISYAEAVTGFEFHMQRAVPVVEGVVVARENEGLVKDAWRQEEEERKRREDGKRIVEALGRWRRFLLKLRVLGRLREEWTETHGEEEEEREEINPFVRRDVRTDSGGGGFVPDQGQEPGGDDEELEPGGFFLEDDEEEVQEPGGFMLVDEDEEAEDPAATFTASAGGFILDIEEDKPADKRPIKDLPKGKEVIRSPYFSQNPLRKKKPNIATTTVEPPPPMANSPRTRRTLESVTITNREKPSAAGGEKGTPKRSGRAVKSRYLDSGPKEVDEELDE